MARLLPWPSAHGTVPQVSVSLADWRPGRVEAESAYTGDRQIIQRGRRLLRGTFSIGMVEDRNVGQAILLLLRQLGDDYTDLPLVKLGAEFVERGIVGPTGAALVKPITVRSVSAVAGQYGVELAPKNPGKTADGVDGALLAAPRAGDLVSIGGQIVQVDGWTPGDGDRGRVDFDPNIDLAISPGDVIAPADSIRITLPPGEVIPTPDDPDFMGPWEGIPWIEWQPPTDIEVSRRPPSQQIILADRSVQVGSTLPITLTNIWTDPDGLPLTYEPEVDGDLVEATLANNVLSLRGLRRGRAVVTIRARSSEGAFSEDSFILTVMPASANRRPSVVRRLRTMSLRTGERSPPVDVSTLFADADLDTLAFEASSSASSVAQVNLAGHSLTVIGANPGEAVVSITATDPSGEARTIKFGVKVAGILPTLPETTPRPEVSTPIGSIGLDLWRSSPTALRPVGHVIRLREHFTGSGLRYTPTDDEETPLVSFEQEGSLLVLRATRAATASDTPTITVVATDERGERASITADITFRAPDNIAPRWTSTPEADAITAVNGTTEVDLNTYATDDDGDDLVFSATIPAAKRTSLQVAVAAGVATFTRRLSTTARDVITITATVRDPSGSNSTVSTTFEVSLPATGDPTTGPVWAIPPRDRTLKAGDPHLDINLGGAIQNAAGDEQTSAEVSVSAESADRSVVEAEIPNRAGLWLRLRPRSKGIAAVTVTAKFRDASNGTGETPTELDVTVRDPNQPPDWGGTPTERDVALQAAPASGDPVTRSLNLDDFVDDRENDSISFTAASSDTSVFTVAATGTRRNRITLTPVSQTTDAATLTLTAQAASGNTDIVEHTVTVNVAAPVVPPDPGLEEESIPDFPPAGETYYPDTEFTIYWSAYYSAGPSGRGVDESGYSVRLVSGLDVLSIRSGATGSVSTTFRCLKAGTARVSVSAREQETGAETQPQTFDVVVQPRTAPIRPRWSALGLPNRRLTFGTTKVLDLLSFVNYIGGNQGDLRFAALVLSGGPAGTGTVDVLTRTGTQGQTLTLGQGTDGDPAPLGFYRIQLRVWANIGNRQADSTAFTLSVVTSGGGGGNGNGNGNGNGDGDGGGV